MSQWPTLPTDVLEWFNKLFAEANRQVSECIANVPNIRESTLDDTLIAALVPRSSPRKLRSGAVVVMNIHNIGGLRRVMRWEAADIAILVFVYRRKSLIGQKIGLLQSKRLYPLNKDVEDDDSIGFEYGMNAFLKSNKTSPASLLQRKYEFSKACVYGAINAAAHQEDVIDRLNKEFGESVYYLLYNPPRVPMTVQYPLARFSSVTNVKLGCRVANAADIHHVIGLLAAGAAPTLQQVQARVRGGGWPLETWASHLLLTCKVGQPFGDDREAIVTRLLERRSGPIGAAIAVSITLPND
jgi:hypothetical protein